MWSLAIKNLLQERVRLLVSVGGVAFAVALIVLLRGLFVAYESKVADYFGSVQADLWVVQSGTADFFHSFSVLDGKSQDQVASVDGVAAAHPYIARQVGFTLDSAQALLYLVGFDPDNPATGPVRLEEGTADVGTDGIVIDRVFAEEHDLEVGDPLPIREVELAVTGISSGGDMVMFQYAYANLDTARDILQMPRGVNAVLAQIGPDVSPVEVAARIEAQSTRLSARSPEQIVSENQQVINDGFLPVISVLLSIGFLVGVTVIGLTIYSAVLERRREYGMLKAVGAGTRQITAVVAAQALLSAGTGYAVGVALAFGMGAAAASWVPEFITDIQATDLAWVAAAALAMAVIASTIPLARIARIDPVEVFRA